MLLGNGLTNQAGGVCLNLKLELQGLVFNINCITLDLGKVDLVLGVQWLCTLGKCEIDWITQEWIFWYNGRRLMLTGETDLHQLGGYFRTLSLDDGQLEIPTDSWLCSLQEKEAVGSVFPPGIAGVLSQFEHIFAKHQVLPSIRGREHAITLKAGITAINGRPYR